MTDDPRTTGSVDAKRDENGGVKRLRSLPVVRLITWGGLSRHGVMASAKQLRNSPLPSRAFRFAWVIPSTALIGLGVALLIRAELGVPPYDVLLSAIADATVLSHGQASWAVSGGLVVVAVLLGARPKVVGAAYVVLAGVAVDTALGVVVTPDEVGVRAAMAVGGMFLLTTGIAVIVHTSATGGAFELIIEAAHERGVNRSILRTVLELATLAIGIVGGGAFGVMTVIVAVTLGPLIAMVLQAFADHRQGRAARLDARPTPV